MSCESGILCRINASFEDLGPRVDSHRRIENPLAVDCWRGVKRVGPPRLDALKQRVPPLFSSFDQENPRNYGVNSVS